MSKKQPNYYAIIPGPVRYNQNLSPQAKLLYGEIGALCNKEGYCWASNQYFADLYGMNKKTISRLITQLIKEGCIESKQKMGKQRKITLLAGGIHKKVE